MTYSIIAKRELIMTENHFARILKIIRKNVDLTQSALSELIGSSPAYVEMLEQGSKNIYNPAGIYNKNDFSSFSPIIAGAVIFQSHRSYYINFGHVSGYEKAIIMLADDLKIPLSRNRSQDFVGKLAGYKGAKDISEQTQLSFFCELGNGGRKTDSKAHHSLGPK